MVLGSYMQRALFLFGWSLVVGGALYIASFRLPFKMTDLLQEGHPIRVNYEKYDKIFGNERAFSILMEQSESGSSNLLPLLDTLKKVNKLLGNNRDIETLFSIKNAEYLKVKGNFVQMGPFLGNDGIISPVAQSQLETDFWKYRLISPDGRHLLITSFFKKEVMGKNERTAVANLIKQVGHLHEQIPGWNFHLLGTKIAEYYIFEDAMRTQKTITPLLLLLLGGLLLFLFRSFKIVLWFYFTMLLAYSLTIYFIFWHNGGLSAYSGFAIFFVLIISTADLIHFFTLFVESDIQDLEEKLLFVRKEIIVPCFWTSASTVIGFVSLMSNKLVPIAHIGLYSSVGSILCFLITFYVLPPSVKFFKFNHYLSEGLPSFMFQKMFSFVIRRPKLVTISFSFFSLLLIYFTGQLRIDDRFFDKFNETHPMTITIEKFTSIFKFLDTVDLGIKFSNKGQASDPFNHQKLKEFETDLEKDRKVSYIKSHPKFYDYLSNTFADGLKDSKFSEETKKVRLDSLYEMMMGMNIFEDFYNPSNNMARSIIFLEDPSSSTVDEVIKNIKKIHHEKYSKFFTLEIMGNASLRSFIDTNLISSIINSVSTGFVSIVIMFAFIFGSIRWAILGILPNIVPLLFIGGVMGFFKVPVESTLSMLVCITMGIAVDDTIHYLYSLKKYTRFEKLSILEGLKKAFSQTSRPLIGTTMVLILSFPCFLLSDLRMYAQAGMFVICSLLFALLADLLLLPALFVLFAKK
ncbi:MAG: hypothetical protein A2504_07965 [Bdellovibrionales bacterium RIFOXYD12_FULL_39_22]|nr:MAG: hypothetical protein A2385_13590 [Bdellovibrionales bacterium RIFOXYB1_FULL_39_21]OFZ44866.1 MAG: hypothetical protein A2485_14800 [Bdellovibrionales bacterium RIFOXYC12_FULL_39_17]OFZ49384.1 MAG: hypothetical protein A2404_09135 [Bdellovibrionales bacterium RIFOXYC1_FULL_39_130]OFZ77105.1 MAG: hypothetical protein A2560_10785 [Bdellovibrionales bacterium RIFOXYD1_FULL_39_84]OFZ95566.1 MAG: hypothetical protein A2504_07965 [Bdellovibrionales bacterium RIFOXYD12_FULL_39_22]